jgi:hypothetical protein
MKSGGWSKFLACSDVSVFIVSPCPCTVSKSIVDGYSVRTSSSLHHKQQCFLLCLASFFHLVEQEGMIEYDTQMKIERYDDRFHRLVTKRCVMLNEVSRQLEP